MKNLIYNNQFILKLMPEMQYTYEIYKSWEEFINELRHTTTFNLKLANILNQICRQKIDLAYEIRPSELNFDYIEFNDAVYSLKEDK
jgi:hypothetical protein